MSVSFIDSLLFATIPSICGYESLHWFSSTWQGLAHTICRKLSLDLDWGPTWSWSLKNRISEGGKYKHSGYLYFLFTIWRISSPWSFVGYPPEASHIFIISIIGSPLDPDIGQSVVHEFKVKKQTNLDSNRPGSKASDTGDNRDRIENYWSEYWQSRWWIASDRVMT